jgi:hypothetical protein
VGRGHRRGAGAEREHLRRPSLLRNSCAGRKEPPIFRFTPSGGVVKSWGSGAFIFPHGFHVDGEGNVWVTDAQGKDGKGHQVFKYSADGALLMTIGTAGVAGDPAQKRLTQRG